MKTLVLGATGACGSALIHLLCENPAVTEVIAPARKPNFEHKHPKLQWVVSDLLQDKHWETLAEGVSVAYCCIGTTQAQTPDKERYKEIDLGLPTRMANACKKYGVPTLAVVSAMGANHKSKLFYPRLKGLMENAIAAANIPHSIIVRPALIVAKREKFRVGEYLAAVITKVINPLLPLKYRSISAERIAQKLIIYTIPQPLQGWNIMESDALQQD
jgi:uncharacterized protein YbjT (DUF2867 family)